MKRQRGFGLLELGIVLGILVALGTLVWWADANIETSAGVDRGRADKQAEWDLANAKATEDRRRRDANVARELIAADNARVAAESKASDADQRWKEATRAADRNRIALGTCSPGKQPVPGVLGTDGRVRSMGEASDPAAGGDRILLTWQFVRDYDAAWTGRTGEPVFDPATRAPGIDAASASPYGLRELRDVAGENAKRCSADRRELDSLIAKLRAAERAWSR